MGQRGYTEEDDPRFALAFVSTREADADRPAFVVDCSFHDSYSSNLGVYDAEGVAIENNVFADSYKTCKQHNNWAIDCYTNLIME